MGWDNLQEIYMSVRQNKLRTALTAFGVFWGIFMLILLLGVGKGLENGAEHNFGSDDRTSIWINARRTALPYKGMPRGRNITLTEDDTRALQESFPELEYISAENVAGQNWQRSLHVSHKDRAGAFSVYGVADDFFRIKKYIDYHFGRPLNSADNLEQRKVALIGTAVHDRLFPNGENPIGKTITFHGIALNVIGVFYDKARDGRMSERIYIPLNTFQRVFGNSRKVNLIVVTPKTGVDSFAFEDAVVAFLKARHKVHPEDVKAFNTFNYAEKTRGLTTLFSAIKVFIWFVGLGTLAAGIVGISNIMIITVKDRTREIGVRKAMGARPASILNMILSESILITGIAGYLGLAAGVGMLQLINKAIAASGGQVDYFANPQVDFTTAFYALVILIAAGAIAGFVPAMRAAKISPVAAMREE